MQNLKLEYNSTLQRAVKYSTLPKETQEKYLCEFVKLIDNLDRLIIEMGYENCTKEEILNGFEV